MSDKQFCQDCTVVKAAKALKYLHDNREKIYWEYRNKHEPGIQILGIHEFEAYERSLWNDLARTLGGIADDLRRA